MAYASAIEGAGKVKRVIVWPVELDWQLVASAMPHIKIVVCFMILN